MANYLIEMFTKPHSEGEGTLFYLRIGNLDTSTLLYGPRHDQPGYELELTDEREFASDEDAIAFGEGYFDHRAAQGDTIFTRPSKTN